ncbi:unnamed protein product [Rhizophagus irregularis]|nr:unnamed protein product [Rhizophagus irregularis]
MHTPTNFDQTDHTGTLTRYDGASPLAGIPSRNDIVAEFDNGMTTILQQSLSGKQPIHFMPTEAKGGREYHSIRPFFDVEVPENYSPSSLKTILARILSVTLKNTTKFGVEDIRAFPLQGYYTEKKAYIRIRTWNHFDRYNALKAVREVSIRTVSDDLNCQYYYCKVAHEERLPLSSWAVLSNYLYEFIPDGEVPNAKYDEDRVFMICMTVHWKDDPEPLKQIYLLKAFALCWKLLAPDIHIGFNDSQYDWWFIVEKANKLGVLEWMFNHMSFKPSSLEKIIKWEYRYNMIKVNDGKFHSKHLKIPGCVAIDVRPCFMGIYSKAEKSSLAFYLNECGLKSKMDMPIHRMNKYYERALKKPDSMLAEQMREVAKYCIIDALSCQRLMVKHNAINEYREVASIAFLLLFDAHYFAGGMKVCNLLSASAWQRGILTSMISSQQTETGKYPGAYVFPPVKGLENRRPVTGLDFASLYPNLIIIYNLSPDKIILSQEHAISVEQSDKKLHKIDVLEYLSGKRNEMKKRLAPLKEKKEDMDLVISSMGKSLSLSEAIEQILANAEVEKHNGFTKNLYHFIHKEKHEFIAEYDSICFDCSCLDKKQYAFKIYMNSFYGTAGDICPEKRFQRCDEAYDSGNGISKEEYWSRMVEISMVKMEKLRDEVNDFLKEDNGSPYLKMAYEEVLFPVVFTGKKKYYGIPHESKPNFNKKLFIQGVEIDLNGVIKTAVWKPDKNNKSVQHFISQMRDRHTREEADAKRLIKRGLTSEPYLYEILEPGERFEYVVVENDSSDKVGNKMEYPEVVRRLGKKINISYYLKTVVSLCARFINYDESFQPSSEIVLEALKKLKDANKAGDNKADDGGVDGDDLDEDEEDEDKMDEDEVSKIRDALAQKSAEKWIRGARIYVKKIFDTTYADKGEHLTNNAYYQSFLNALDKQEESIRLKLSSLLKEISEVDIEYRDSMYKLVTKKRAMSLEQYLISYYLDECKLLADF